MTVKMEDIEALIGKWFVYKKTSQNSWQILGGPFDDEGEAIKRRNRLGNGDDLEVRQTPDVTKPR